MRRRETYGLRSVFEPQFMIILLLHFLVSFLGLKVRVGKEQVIRNGGRVEISIFDIVVGDVVPLDNGDQVNEHL